MYLWPPRPEKSIMPDALSMFTNLGWAAQIKKNGTCSVLSYDPSKEELVAWTRHNEAHKLWQPSLTTCLRRFRELKGGLYVMVGELLHSKVPGIRDTMYLFDVLIADGQELSGRTLHYRSELLHSLWDESAGDHYNMPDKQLWTSNLLTTDFKSLFKSLGKPEDEGLVMKNPNATLGSCQHQSNNQAWQVKCRRTTKNYTA